MAIYRTFHEALAAWRERGGALNYYSSPEGWEVIDAGTAEASGRPWPGTVGAEYRTPRELTEHAPEQIAQEMADWQD